ncbi:PREDICTED: farnesol dehydrogenase-like [Papilio polytes]|uniref:farnesol dehydrogenase-like n=1 Tax=Papilio polytes TaxID=76194 RepID=UPI00067660E6|nr:PREDICTED: farnesol dehydrogenase-like [Papilio polytes]
MVSEMERWSNKTAVVTGASAGIGAAVCVGLANAGLQVVGFARRPELIEKLKGNVRGKGVIYSRKCDVSNIDDIKAAFKWVDEKLGGTDVLVNNAGVLYYPGLISDSDDKTITDEEISATIDINIKGLVICTKYAIASMKKRNFDGHVININSVAGHYIPSLAGYNVYPSTKHAVTAFNSSLLHELADCKHKIKVTSLSPGLVATEMAGKHVTEDVPMLQPSDVADALLYVLSTPPHVNIEELTIGSVLEKRR